jgi:CRISPR-associated protein Csm5
MKSYLDVYHVTLTCLSPVFIGSGRSIIKKEYLIDNNFNISIFDIPKMYAKLKAKGLADSYDRFLSSSDSLGEWLKVNKVSREDISECIKYQLKNSDFSVKREELRTLEIMEFVKDPYGLPYIPGSSIKGMLRTILLGSKIINDPNGYGHFKDDIRKALDDCIRRAKYRPDRRLLKREAEDLEAKGFRTLKCNTEKIKDAVNDIMKGFIVGDSEPVSTDQLSVCQRIELHHDGAEKKLNVTRECLKPGTEIKFTLTVDRAVCRYTDELILKAIEDFNNAYNSYFVKKFTGAAPVPNECVLIGGGCGYASKTVTYPLFADEGVPEIINIFWGTMPEKIFYRHKHDEYKEKNLAPHILKTSRYQGKLYQTGLCRIRFSRQDIKK